MKYRLLGNSGLRVSEMCLGTMTFGMDWGWGSVKDESRKIYDAFRAAGGNFIDTANMYTNGTSEQFVGEFARDHRDQVVIATKYTNSVPNHDPNSGGNHRKNMFQAIDASLKRLNTDYIDLYWLHIWDKITPPEEVMRGFDDLQRMGKILYAGVSDAPAWWIARANTLAEVHAQTRFVGLQVEYSLIERTVERELLPMAAALHLGVTAWSPLAGGILSGKYHGGDATEGRLSRDGMDQFKPDAQRSEQIVSALRTVAGQLEKSPAQVALAWLFHRPQPVIPIIGAKKIDQLHDNLAATEISLSPEQLKALDGASQIQLGFPHDFYEKEMVRNFVYAGTRDWLIV